MKARQSLWLSQRMQAASGKETDHKLKKISIPRSAIGPVSRALSERFAEVLNVLDFGAKGDGTTDDTAAIRAAIAAASAGATVHFPRPNAHYLVSDVLEVATPIRLTGAGSGVCQVTGNTALLRVVSSDVTIDGLALIGPQFASRTGSAIAIDAYGKSAEEAISGIAIRNCRIASWGEDAIRLQFVTDFVVADSIITDVHYAGVMAFSVQRGVISGNMIRNVIGEGLAYGITLNRAVSADVVAHPRTTDVVVSGNVVDGVHDWEGIDTHGGKGITVVGNRVLNCKVGIAVVAAAASGGAVDQFLAPIDVSVIGNVVDSGKTDGTADVGISFVGARGNAAGDPYVELGTGTIIGNVVRGHGEQGDPFSGAIYIRTTKGLVVSGNNVVEPSPYGIHFYAENFDCSVVANTVTDAWDGTVNAIAYFVNEESQSLLFTGNVCARGTKTAEKVNTFGLRIDSDTDITVHIGLNRFDGATTGFSDPGKCARTGFYGAAGIAKPTITGSRGGNAALESLLAELANIGLITNSTVE